MLAAAVISICFNLALWWTVPGMAARQDGLVDDGGTMIPLAMSIVASFIYLRRL